MQNKLFEIRAQVLIKQNVLLGIQITHFSWNFYNFSTDMSAIFVWLKPCLTNIERWQPAKMSQLSSSLYDKLFEIRAQVLIKENIFGACKWPISVEIFIIFPRIWVQYLFYWSHVWLALNVDNRRKCHKFNAAKQVQHCIRSLSRSERKF